MQYHIDEGKKTTLVVTLLCKSINIIHAILQIY